MRKFILFTGIQASGKGTQARIISEKYGLFRFEMGLTLREESKLNTKRGLKVRKLMESGKLLPDEIITAIVKDRLFSCLGSEDIISDGYPRTLEQEKIIRATRESRQVDFWMVHIMISEAEALKRISGRRECSKCGANYGYIHGAKEVCDHCGAKLAVRADERPEILVKRFADYRGLTEPLIKQYRDSGQYIEINGEQTVDAVTNDLLKALRAHKLLRK